MTRMLACEGVSVRVCVRVYALRIVSRDKIFHFKNTVIIIIIITCSENANVAEQRLGSAELPNLLNLV